MPKKMILAAAMSEPWLPVVPDNYAVNFLCFEAGEQLSELPEDWYSVFEKLGFTMLQVDTPHLNTNETSENCWDWSTPDELIEKCLKHGFGPIYFPHWHWPPPWYEKSNDFTGCRCLRHNKSIPCFSLWSPKIKPWFERCIKALREHYPADEQIPGIYLGIYGDFGEAMYPVEMGIGHQRLKHDRDLENAHWHPDFWCNDEYAQKDFHSFLLEKYGSLTDLNSAWSSNHDSIEQVKYPSKPTEDIRRPWLDFNTVNARVVDI